MNHYYTLTKAFKLKNVRTFCLTVLALLLMQLYANAQYSNVPVTGFNADVVGDGAVGAGTNSTTADVDGVNYIFVSTTFNPGSGVCTTTSTALPATNLITSLITPALTYSLQPYNANNVLRLANGTTGTLSLVTPTSAANLYLLATGGSGACNLSVTVNFTDLTTQVITGTVNDWCSGSSPATAVFYRIINTSTTCNGGTCQYLYEVNLALLGSNYSKSIASIQIQNLAGSGVLNVFAVGAKAPCATPTAQATSLISTATTTGSISGSFTDASPIPTGGYLVVRYPSGATPTAPVTGTTYTAGQTLGTGTVIASALTTTFSTSNLSANTPYDFYVYAYNTGTTCGGPVYLTTTPLVNTLTTSACGTTTGTLSIGPGGSFTSLTAALASINSTGLAGNTILELQATYDGTSANETFPIVFPLNACIGSAKTLTIRPASGVIAPLIITSSNATATLNMNGASYVTFDGRPGGIGTTSQLSIINTSGTGVAIQFINDAHHNTFRYCDVQGQNLSSTSSALSGVIYFAGTTTLALAGNDYNTIANCDIHATVADFPAIGICSYGNNVATPVTSWNDSNTITNCNIYDFFSAALASTAIKLDGGSNAFTISNNKVYQTATRNYTTSNQHRAFWLTPTATGACGFIVTNNFIGGNNSAGTGVWTLTSASTILTNFWGMDINHAGLIHTSVQGNTITNISLSSNTTTANDLFRGISTGNTGNVDIGTVTGNTIGSATATGAILLSTTGNSSVSYGIKSGSTVDTVNVYNNIIGGITLSSATTTNALNFYGIGVTSGAYNFIVGNKIGSSTVNNSINSSDPATTVQSVYGISVAAGTVSTVSNNIISNLNNGYISTSTGYTRGITVTTSTTTTITGNTVRNLSSASTYTGSGTTAALVGIQMSTSNPATVTGNVIDSLVLTSASTGIASYVEGLVFSSNGSTPTNLITKNFIHSLDVTAANTSAFIVGMDIIGGSNIIANNMIRLGVKSDGTDLNTSLVIRGMFINTTTASNIYHNTVYIGGIGVGTVASNTVAFYRNTSVLGSQHDVRNNIFMNDRSNATTGGKHYQIFLNNTTALNISNNNYYGSGVGSVFGTLNNGTSDVINITSGWINTDLGSSISNPRLIAATGTASTVNLHITAATPTPVEATGVLLSTITDDYDGQTRSGFTPVDIGADAGNFTALPMSIDSTVVDQNTALVPKGSANQYIVRIRVYAKDNYTPLQVNSFSLNTTGTTSASDISNAKVFSTGVSNTFATTTQYGTTTAAPSGAFTISGTNTLVSGVNYFWVTYDINSTAVINNNVDVTVSNISLTGSVSPAILNGSPAGSRTIKAPLSGTYTVGSGQTYGTIAAAMADLTALGVSAPVVFSLTDATYTLTDSVAVGAFAGASATNTATLRPAATNASGATITSSSTTSTFEINGASYFIIDGRPGGTGAAITVPNTTYLNIINTTTTGVTIRLNNESRNNTIKYCDLQGVNNVNATLQGTSAGVVFIGLTSGLLGNDSNTIDNCNIHSTANTNVLTMGIYSYGPASSSALIAPFNDNNTVSNCNIYDTYGGVNLSTGGIVLDRGTNGWNITGNSFFATATRTPVLTAGVANRGIYIATTNTTGIGNGFTITGNYFGGTQPLCGGTAYTSNSTGSFNNLHESIYISANGGATSNIKANTFTNINISQAASTADIYHAVWVNHNGNINIGGPSPSDGNIIGSSTTTGAITLASTGGLTPSHMILMSGSANANSSSNVLIQNNKIGGITLTGAGNSFTAIFCGSGATVNILNNLIGSTTVANSIFANNTGTTAQFVRGINVPSAAPVLTISNNTIANLSNNGTATTTGTNGTNANLPQTQGIYIIGTSTVGPIVTGNVIKNLANASPMASVGTAAAIGGIAVANTSAITAANISNNIVDSLFSTSSSTTAAISPVGITYLGPTAVVNTVSRNSVNNIDLTAVNTAALIKGIEITGGAVNVYNNMVRLGIHADGTDLTTSLAITGILKSGGGNNKFYHNTVYIGGASVGTTAKNSAAFQRTSTGIDDVRNNIFVNNRSNATTGGKHYQLLLNASTTLTLNNNIYYGTGTGAAFASANGGTSDTTAFKAGWIPTDLNSIVGNPQFISATGPTATADLHIHATNPTPVEAGGVLISLVTDDYDGQVRSSNTPVDIGADAGNFVQTDLVGPTIGSFVASNTSSTANRTISVTISDNTGVATGGSAPKIYYYKSSGGVAGSYASTAGTLASGTAQNGQWNFVITSANMGGLLLNDSVYYYIAAQDISGGSYLSSLPAGATNFGATPPPTLLSYKIVNGYSGNINIGVGQTFTSLTAAGGIFDSINKGSLSGDVTLTVTSDLLLEDGTVALTQWAESGTGNYKVTIVPNSATERLIVGNVATSGSGLIRFDGADRVKFDGRFAGSGRYLRIRNRAQLGTTFIFLNDAHRDTITYCTIEGINNTSGIVLFSTTTSTTGSGNDSNGINNCFIGDTLGSIATSNRPTTIISSTGTANFENSENTIANNNMYNYTTNGISVTATGNGNNWNITGNSFYNNMPTPVAIGQVTINFIPGVLSVNNKISGNYIGGNAALCGGTAFTNTGNITWKAISVNTGTADSNYLQNNTIQNINLTGIGSGVFTGIEVLGGLTSINGNTLGHATTANSIQTPLLGTIIGIWVNGTTVIPQIYTNVIGNITSTGATSAVGVNGIRIATANTNFPIGVRNNTITALTGANVTVSTATPAMAGIVSTLGAAQYSILNNTVSNLVNTGAAATNVIGINISSTTAAGTVSSNLIYGLNNTSNTNTAQIVGIHLDASYMMNIVNNMVSLGYNVDSSAIIAGILDKSASTINQVYYNTVSISGNATSINSTISQAYRRTTTSGTIVRNNIFKNTRTAGTANYAVTNISTTPGTGWVANNNILSASNIAQIGLWSSFPSTLAVWKTTSLFDSNSVSYATLFTSNTDLHLTGTSIGHVALLGKPISGFTTDYDGQTRNALYPYIGADENLASPLPVKLTLFTAVAKDNNVLLNWNTASEENNSGFEVERSADGKTFDEVGFVKAAGSSNTTNSYALTDEQPFVKTNSNTLYYRLKQIDYNGATAYSEVVVVNTNDTKLATTVSVFPNPTDGDFTLTVYAANNGSVTMTILDIQGKVIASQSSTVSKGNNNIFINSSATLQPGVYFVKVNVNGENNVLKLMKH